MKRALLVAILAPLLFCGCRGTIYENDNGARGPERISVPEFRWPGFMDGGCCPPK